MPSLQVGAGRDRVSHVPSAPFRDLHSAFRKGARLSEMTGEERLAIALDLHEVSCDIAREGIRHDHPEADPAEVERLLRRRLELTRAG
jgi:Rv0078B-related antitoxin